jgi:micrococcal nuclease
MAAGPRARARRLNRGFVVGALLLLAALYYLRVPASQKAVPVASATAPTPDLPVVPVLAAVDGDTLEVQWEGRREYLRYFGVDTPERGQPCYDEATARNRALAGARVWIEFDERTRDPGGRLLAYVYSERGESIDETLVREGLGRAWRRDGSRRAQLIGLEEEARAARRGCLWGKRP